MKEENVDSNSEKYSLLGQQKAATRCLGSDHTRSGHVSKLTWLVHSLVGHTTLLMHTPNDLTTFGFQNLPLCRLSNDFTTHRLTESLVSDNGTAFTSVKLAKFAFLKISFDQWNMLPTSDLAAWACSANFQGSHENNDHGNLNQFMFHYGLTPHIPHTPHTTTGQIDVCALT